MTSTSFIVYFQNSYTSGVKITIYNYTVVVVDPVRR
jgi:hypothetical protein